MLGRGRHHDPFGRCSFIMVALLWIRSPVDDQRLLIGRAVTGLDVR
jgi:hypothetical protein